MARLTETIYYVIEIILISDLCIIIFISKFCFSKPDSGIILDLELCGIIRE